MKIKGQQEDVAKVGVLAPDDLATRCADRGELRAQRAKERCLGCLGMRGIDVALVARVRADAEQRGASSATAWHMATLTSVLCPNDGSKVVFIHNICNSHVKIP